ncbi:MAG TPA: thiamine phosphate synthase [Terriglobia bacterium]|nr:thiamine phosphate synthase [Terriglobia bacterium]
MSTSTRNPQAAAIKLCYITDRRTLSPRPLLPRILEAIRARVDMVQIREKDLFTRELVALVQGAVIGAAETHTQIVVNDRLDVALALGAAGVHLGTSSMPPEAVRSCVGADFLVGVSCHSLDEALRAEAAGANYVLLGPIFPTPSKLAYGPPLGLQTLRDTSARLKIPVFALGGINVERARPCLEAGARGLAGISLFQECDSLEERVQELRAQIAGIS